MRTLSSTLLAAQKASFVNALYKVVLTKGASTYTYEKDRISPSQHDEEPYSHQATIVLDNHDGVLDDIDLKGYKAILSYGVVASGEEYSGTAPVWVLDQQFNSDPNKLTCTLELQGAFNLMADDEASANYIPDAEDTKTVKDLVNAIVGATLAPFSLCKAYEVVWDTGYDALADTYKPKDGFRIYTRGNRLAALRRVLDYTSNVARWEDDGKVHILKPVTTGTTYDYEYSLERGDHKFFSKAYKNTLVIPNKIYVKSYADDDPQYSGSAQIADYASLPDEVKKTRYIQAKLESNGQAEDIAEALIAKAEMWSKRGAAPVPLNVGQEVFDYVKVTDSRQGDTRTGNLGYVHRRFGKDTWTMTFGFGNWVDQLKYNQILKDLETYTEAGQYFSRLSVGDLYVEHILADSLDMVWIDPEGNIDLDKIGDTLDNLPDGEVYARVKSLHLDAGQLKLDENVWYKSGYDPSTKWTGSNLDDLPDGTTYHRVKSAALTAGGLVLLDQVTVGTYGLVLAADISAGHIKLDNVVTGTYGLVKSTDISAGHIVLSSCEGDIDDIANGSTYGKVKLTQLSAGNLYISDTCVYETGYNPSTKANVTRSASAPSSPKTGDIWIETDAGDKVWTYNGSTWIQAYTEISGGYLTTGIIDCQVVTIRTASSGTRVVLDSGGIDIFGQAIEFKTTGGSYRGAIYGNTGLTITATGRLDITSSGHLYLTGITSGYNLYISYDKVYLSSCICMILPGQTSAPTGEEGMMVYNASTGYTNIYHSGAWHHLNRDAGWA
jgi:hypothetical protein